MHNVNRHYCKQSVFYSEFQLPLTELELNGVINFNDKKSLQRYMLNDEDLKEEWDKHVREESKLDKELLASCEAGRAIIGNSNF